MGPLDGCKLKIVFVICKEAVNLMKQQKYGRIVNVSSIAGRNKSIVSGVHTPLVNMEL